MKKVVITLEGPDDVVDQAIGRFSIEMSQMVFDERPELSCATGQELVRWDAREVYCRADPKPEPANVPAFVGRGHRFSI